MKPVLLDLFCGAGGCTKGYQRAGFYVIGVDVTPQPNYCGDLFIQADAVEFLAEAIDRFCPFNYAQAVHASPPCQGYHSLGNDHPQLIGQVRDLLMLVNDEVPWVIENIEDARWAMNDPVTVCGTMFDPILGVRRHRLFETNWDLVAPDWPCRHDLTEPCFDVYEHGKWRKRRFVPVYGTGGGKSGHLWGEAMGIDWMTRDQLKEAVPPAYTELIGRQLMAHLARVVA